jgi:hypothetical protein
MSRFWVTLPAYIWSPSGLETNDVMSRVDGMSEHPSMETSFGVDIPRIRVSSAGTSFAPLGWNVIFNERISEAPRN